MKEENIKKEYNVLYDDYSGSMFNDLYLPKEVMDELLDASNRLLMNQRSDKIDKLLDDVES